ncbi:MAG: hypothetical protein ACRDPW_03010 [Mycobacteriales bacterium]
MSAITQRATDDAMLSYLHPLVTQAANEFPAGFAELKDRFPIADRPVCLLGGSAGGAGALEVLARQSVPVAATALVNPTLTSRGPSPLRSFREPRRWTRSSPTGSRRICPQRTGNRRETDRNALWILRTTGRTGDWSN